MKIKLIKDKKSQYVHINRHTLLLIRTIIVLYSLLNISTVFLVTFLPSVEQHILQDYFMHIRFRLYSR